VLPTILFALIVSSQRAPSFSRSQSSPRLPQERGQGLAIELARFSQYDLDLLLKPLFLGSIFAAHSPHSPQPKQLLLPGSSRSVIPFLSTSDLVGGACNENTTEVSAVPVMLFKPFLGFFSSCRNLESLSNGQVTWPSVFITWKTCDRILSGFKRHSKNAGTERNGWETLPVNL
jgi:hypothetical protein